MLLEEEKFFPLMNRTAPGVDGKSFLSSWAFRLPGMLKNKKAGMTHTEARIYGAPVDFFGITINQGARQEQEH